MKLIVNWLIKLGILKKGSENRDERSELKPRKLNGKVVQCLPNQTERRLLCNHIKLTTSLRITT
jgi:hypothetical protein